MADASAHNGTGVGLLSVGVLLVGIVLAVPLVVCAERTWAPARKR